MGVFSRGRSGGTLTWDGGGWGGKWGIGIQICKNGRINGGPEKTGKITEKYGKMTKNDS